jgi:hypothetical protein
MARILAAITQAFRENTAPVRDGVHFHGGPQGPYVCENPRCVSPGLEA